MTKPITLEDLPEFPTDVFCSATLTPVFNGAPNEMRWTNRKAYLSRGAARQHIRKYYGTYDGAIYTVKDGRWMVDTLAMWPADCAICDQPFANMSRRYYGRPQEGAVGYANRRQASLLVYHRNDVFPWEYPAVCQKCHSRHFSCPTTDEDFIQIVGNKNCIEQARALTRPTLFELESA